jgi:hypothetical protein
MSQKIFMVIMVMKVKEDRQATRKASLSNEKESCPGERRKEDKLEKGGRSEGGRGEVEERRGKETEREEEEEGGREGAELT